MNDFVFDLDVILKTLDISELTLCKENGLKPASVSNWIKGIHEPDRRSMEAIYEYAFEKGLRINNAHEEPFSDLCRKQGLKLLFHGARSPFKEDPDLHHSKEYNDLGMGFYCGETFLQSAAYMAGYEDSCVYGFGLDLKGLKQYEFSVDTNWVLTIAYQRGLLKRYHDSKILKEIVKKSQNKDILIAPIADNRMFAIIREFTDGMITDEACAYALSSYDLGRQYVLKSEKAIERLGFLKQFYLCKKEKEFYLLEANKMRSERYDNISDFRSKNRNGKYIEEILYE